MQAKIDKISFGGNAPLALLAGPCVIESRDHVLRMADALRQICRRLETPLVFKASFDKANRSSVHSFRGVGLDEALKIFAEIRREFDVPVVTDIHAPEQARPAGQVVDCLQIPAFLCRQTDLLVAAGETGKCVNIKKGQFMSPEEMRNAVEKVAAQGNENVLVTDRGTFFGYNRLVNDMTCIPRMKPFAPVIFDATHSCQAPGGQGDRSGGSREFIAPLAQAAVAAGVDGLFLEVHDNPEQAKSDAATQFPLDQFEALLSRLLRIREAVVS